SGTAEAAKPPTPVSARPKKKIGTEPKQDSTTAESAAANGQTHGRVIAMYDYTNEDGKVLHQTVRYEPRKFSQRRPDPDRPGRWIENLKGVTLVPYRLDLLTKADDGTRVYIGEGEKDVDQLVKSGVTATTNPMGALKWRNEFSPHLRGKHVVVLPDHD